MPCETSYGGYFNGSWRDELLNGIILIPPKGTQDADPGVAAALEHDKAAQRTRQSPAHAGERTPSIAALRYRYATPAAVQGAEGDNALKFDTYHTVGTGQHTALCTRHTVHRRPYQ